MRFRLTYDGELKASGNNNNRMQEKWAIRRALSPQLQELWDVHPVLRGMALGYSNAIPGVGQPGPERLAAFLRQPIDMGGQSFLPLVRTSLFLTCGLQILFLRKTTPGSLVTGGGDLDNRMKTLFDGLRMPTISEMAKAQPNSDLTYCLLEDDSLITELSVQTDRLFFAE